MSAQCGITDQSVWSATVQACVNTRMQDFHTTTPWLRKSLVSSCAPPPWAHASAEINRV